MRLVHGFDADAIEAINPITPDLDALLEEPSL